MKLLVEANHCSLCSKVLSIVWQVNRDKSYCTTTSCVPAFHIVCHECKLKKEKLDIPLIISVWLTVIDQDNYVGTLCQALITPAPIDNSQR